MKTYERARLLKEGLATAERLCQLLLDARKKHENVPVKSCLAGRTGTAGPLKDGPE